MTSVTIRGNGVGASIQGQKVGGDGLGYGRVQELEKQMRCNEVRLELLEGQLAELMEAMLRLEKMYSRDKQRKVKTELAKAKKITKDIVSVCDSPVRSEGLAIRAYGEHIILVDLADPGMFSYLRKICHSPESLKKFLQRTRCTVKIVKKYMEVMGWEKRPEYAVAIRRY